MGTIKKMHASREAVVMTSLLRTEKKECQVIGRSVVGRVDILQFNNVQCSTDGARTHQEVGNVAINFMPQSIRLDHHPVQLCSSVRVHFRELFHSHTHARLVVY